MCCVRVENLFVLVGLSGVGKTRFVQALFETDVGSRALDKELVVYADVGRGPSPSPTFVLDKLISEKKKVPPCHR